MKAQRLHGADEAVLLLREVQTVSAGLIALVVLPSGNHSSMAYGDLAGLDSAATKQRLGGQVQSSNHCWVEQYLMHHLG